MENQQANTEKRSLTDKLSAVGWGLFFVWIGVAWLLNVGTGIGLLEEGLYYAMWRQQIGERQDPQIRALA